MFTTFQTTSIGLSPSGVGEGGENARPGRAAGSRRISTSNACVECRRRKIRCDGTQPCGQCQWYQHPEGCNYSKPAQRVIPSRKLVERLSSSIEQHQVILKRLFGSKDLDSLVSLSREDLLNLALSQPAVTSPAVSLPAGGGSEHAPRSDGAESLDALQQPPESFPEWEGLKAPVERIQAISDDVNGLSMRFDRQSTYVGISSINAALKVIFKTNPSARAIVRNHTSETVLPSRAASPPPQSEDPLALPSSEEGEEYIKTYFEKVHPFFPMIDEEGFWENFRSDSRKDSSWFILLNMVLALGCLANGTSEDERHTIFFQRARLHMDPRRETFNNPSWEILQGLGMMGGYYLHYLNRPNEADALMGATMRIACAIGAHREYVAPQVIHGAGSSEGGEQFQLRRSRTTADIQRRTWWSLFCLDTWATTTTGRPSLGRTSLGVTVNEPGKSEKEHIRPDDLKSLQILPLIHNTSFCKIATTIQDKLSAMPLIPFEELNQLDADLVRWWDDLPSMLTKDPEDSIPSFLHVPRLVMKWRYQNLRIVLHRPYLLSAALRKAPFASLEADEKVAVGKCRIVAAKTIEDIAAEGKEELICGWNGVWMCYQAVFVPLVSLFTDMSNPEEIEKWRTQVNTAIGYFCRMKSYSIAAEKSKEVVSRLLEGAKSALESYDAQRRQQEALMAVVAQREREREQQQKLQETHLQKPPHETSPRQQPQPQHHEAQLSPQQLPPSSGFPPHINGMPKGVKLESNNVSPLHQAIEHHTSPIHHSFPMGTIAMSLDSAIQSGNTSSMPGVAPLHPTTLSPVQQQQHHGAEALWHHHPHDAQAAAAAMAVATMPGIAMCSGGPTHMPQIPPAAGPAPHMVPNFWEDMMWETIPDMDGTGGQGYGMGGGFDAGGWNHNGGQGGGGMDGSGGGHWDFGPG